MKSNLQNLIGKGKKESGGNWYTVLVKERVEFTSKGQPIKYPAICSTKFSELLELHKKNRKVDRGHIKKLWNSVTTLGAILRAIVVVKLGDNYYIADGQNFRSALLGENMPIDFYLFEVKNEKQLIEVMSQMNSSARRWGISQFVNVNTNDKKANSYNKLQKLLYEYANSTKMTHRVLAAMMYDEKFNPNASEMAIRGDYFVQNVPEVRLKLRLNFIKKFYKETKMSATSYLNNALCRLFYEKGDKIYKKNEKEFLKEVSLHIKKCENTSTKYGNWPDALEMLHTCWARL